MFQAPEMSAGREAVGLENCGSWDLAVRFQELASAPLREERKRKLRERAIGAVLRRARASVPALIRPERIAILDAHGYAENGMRGEIALEDTLEENGFRAAQLAASRMRFECRVPKDRKVLIGLDASLSMRGEKLALLAVAAGAVAIALPSADIALMGFDSRPRRIKAFGETLSPAQAIERVLSLPTNGLTNLEAALLEAERQLARARDKRAALILISDGKYTEGADPARLGRRFGSFNALKTGRDKAGRPLLVELCRDGKGRLFEAAKMEDLPRAIYHILRAVTR